MSTSSYGPTIFDKRTTHLEIWLYSQKCSHVARFQKHRYSLGLGTTSCENFASPTSLPARILNVKERYGEKRDTKESRHLISSPRPCSFPQLIDWLVFYGTSTQRSIYQGGLRLLMAPVLRIANEEHTKTYRCMRYNEHMHATTNNRYALLA